MATHRNYRGKRYKTNYRGKNFNPNHKKSPHADIARAIGAFVVPIFEWVVRELGKKKSDK